MWKSAVALAGFVALIGYVAAGFTDRGYHRDIDGPPERVRAALGRLDLSAQPGMAGVAVRQAAAADRITWYVMSGDAVAARFTAALEPAGDGRTRLSAGAEHGEVPDARLPAPLRSDAQAMTVFASAINAALAPLAAPRATAPMAAVVNGSPTAQTADPARAPPGASGPPLPASGPPILPIPHFELPNTAR